MRRLIGMGETVVGSCFFKKTATFCQKRQSLLALICVSTAAAALPAAADDRKTPSGAPTQEVRSVIGMRGVPSGNLQLLPPKQDEPAEDAEVVSQPESSSPAPAARMVTRADASLRGFRKSWEPNGQEVAVSPPPMTMRTIVPETQPVPKTLDAPLPPNSPQSIARSQLSPPLPLSSPMSTVGDRRSYPAWLSPNQTQAAVPGAVIPDSAWRPRGEVRQPLRDPVVTAPMRELPPVAAGVDAEPETMLAPLGDPSSAYPVQSPLTTSTDEQPIGSGVMIHPPSTLTAPPKPEAENSGFIPLEGPEDTPTQVTPPQGRSVSSANALPESEALPGLDGLDDAPSEMEELVELIPPPQNSANQLSSGSRRSVNMNSGNTDSGVTDRGANTADRNEGNQVKQVNPSDEVDDRLAEQRLESIENHLRGGTGNKVDSQASDSAAEMAPPQEKQKSSASTLQLRPIRINSLRETPAVDEATSTETWDSNGLEPLDAAAPLQDIDADQPDTGRLSEAPSKEYRLDATGRPKTYPGDEAARLDRSILQMRRSIESTLQANQRHHEIADRRSNWGMMHAIMVYGADTRLVARGREYSTIAWLAGNNVCRGARLMTTNRGKIEVRQGTGLQGHQGQFLCILSLAGVPSDYPLYVGRQKFSVQDLVDVEAAACREGDELTFTLIGLAHYMDTESTWQTKDGQTWNFERLLAAELSQPIVGQACGGTHRLMAFAHALRKRRVEGQPIVGQWKRANDFLEDFVDYTYQMQNRDGSFSTNWFESRADDGELNRKVQTTGHIAEFLLTYLPDEELVDPRLTRSINYLLHSIQRLKIEDSAVGFRGHALRALAMYHTRVYGEPVRYDTATSKPQSVAGRTTPSRSSNTRRRSR